MKKGTGTPKKSTTARSRPAPSKPAAEVAEVVAGAGVPTARVTGREAMIRVLTEAGGPLKTKEIVERALKVEGVRLAGKTPGATLAAKLATEHVKGGVFVRTAPGTYGLREVPAVAAAAPMTDKELDAIIAGPEPAATPEEEPA